MNTHSNTSFAKYQTYNLYKQDTSHSSYASTTRSFDLSIAQLENWQIRPNLTRRNGPSGLRRDIKRILKLMSSYGHATEQLSKPVIAPKVAPIFKAVKYTQQGIKQAAMLLNSKLDKVQLNRSSIDTAQSESTVNQTSPMQRVVKTNLVKDGLAAAVWIVIAPTVMILGTVAGF